MPLDEFQREQKTTPARAKERHSYVRQDVQSITLFCNDEHERMIGKHHHCIDYQHAIHSLVRKPGAFAAYRYRDDLFPTTIFRQAYDCLASSGSERADRAYVRILHLAAITSEAEVATAVQIVPGGGQDPVIFDGA